MPQDENQKMRVWAAGMRLFKRFTLQKLLGRGEMSVVWLARDQRLRRLVALKLAPDSVCRDPAARENLKSETRKNLLLTHPNVARVFDFVEDEQAAAICLEYMDGPTLADARAQKQSKCLGILELAPWVGSLCDALAYAHESAGLSHRGLKPTNVMVNSRSEIKVTDFGIAASLRDSRSPESVLTSIGTLSYMSPQQLRGEDPSPSDDIYALGAILYEMLSSKPPFYSGDVASQVREATAPPISRRRVTLGITGDPIPQHWEDTIAACLAKHPERRPKSAAEVAGRLQLEGMIRLTTAREIVKPVFQRYLKIGALAGGAAAVLGAAVIFSRSSSPGAGASLRSTLEKEISTRDPLAAPAEPAPTPNGDEAQTLGPETENTTVQLVTRPPGATFAIYSGIVQGTMAPAADSLRRGATPGSVASLPPGRYTIFLHLQGWPDERAEITLKPGETLPFEYTFPHGSVTITSTPDGAEIFAGETLLGQTPLTVALPLGKQELTARYGSFSKKTEVVTVESEAPANVAFQFRARSHSPPPKPKEPQSAWGKLGNSLKKVFSSKPAPKTSPKPSPKTPPKKKPAR
jgi:serine/threonine protein kinase